MSENSGFKSEVRGIYYENGLQLCVLKKQTEFWLTRAQLCEVFSCSEQRIHNTLFRIRRQGNLASHDMVQTFPLILQKPSSRTRTLCENVRNIQHFNQEMVLQLAQYLSSIHIERFLYWCEYLAKNSIV